MIPTVLILVLVVLTVAWWLLTDDGFSALGVCVANPRLFLPAVFVMGVHVAERFMPEGYTASLFDLEFHGARHATTSVAWAVSGLAQIAAVSWLLRSLGPVLGVERPAFDTVLRRVAVLYFVTWAATLAISTGLFLARWINDDVASSLYVPALFATFAVDTRAASLLPIVYGPRDTSARDLIASSVDPYARNPRPWRVATFVYLLAIGAATFTWVETPAISATSASLHHDFPAVGLAARNGWVSAVSEAFGVPVPTWVELLAAATTAVLSSVFVVAYAIVGRRAELERVAAPAEPPRMEVRSPGEIRLLWLGIVLGIAGFSRVGADPLGALASFRGVIDVAIALGAWGVAFVGVVAIASRSRRGLWPFAEPVPVPRLPGERLRLCAAVAGLGIGAFAGGLAISGAAISAILAYLLFLPLSLTNVAYGPAPRGALSALVLMASFHFSLVSTLLLGAALSRQHLTTGWLLGLDLAYFVVLVGAARIASRRA